MKLLGKVLGTYSANKDSKSSMPRPKVDFLNLIENYGIENDKFAQKDLDKTVMILGINSYDKSYEHNISLEFGSLGENILFDFNPHDLEVGTILKINNAEIEITEKCTICNHLSIFDKKLPKIVKDCRGLYCKILKNGTIEKDNDVYIKG
ncbi:MOSC domain-containing protein [Arcobacter sp.]|uniref:MOSC domain-containing protein n=1 Tax=Arcobacter sp. TaxID=1872629 RepID=UPI003D1205D0